MKRISLLLYLCSFFVGAQTTLIAEFVKKQAIDVDELVSFNDFGSFYQIKDNVVFEQYARFGKIDYSNIQLGSISSADTFNPLKINLFYHDFNTVVILDNRLAEITKIDFNTLEPFRIATHVSTGNDNTIWLYNQNTQQLELFDYVDRKTRIKTLPIDGDVMQLKSDYNFCWVLTEAHLYKYNYVGSLLYKISNKGYSKLKENNTHLFLLRDNKLFYKDLNYDTIELLELPELLINQFFVTNDSVYIYADEILHQFQLKSN